MASVSVIVEPPVESVVGFLSSPRVRAAMDKTPNGQQLAPALVAAYAVRLAALASARHRISAAALAVSTAASVDPVDWTVAWQLCDRLFGFAARDRDQLAQRPTSLRWLPDGADPAAAGRVGGDTKGGKRPRSPGSGRTAAQPKRLQGDGGNIVLSVVQRLWSPAIDGSTVVCGERTPHEKELVTAVVHGLLQGRFADLALAAGASAVAACGTQLIAEAFVRAVECCLSPPAVRRLVCDIGLLPSDVALRALGGDLVRLIVATALSPSFVAP